MIIYDDPEKGAKFAEALDLGLLERVKDKDGVYGYSLTAKGIHQWMLERSRR